jgi:2-methylisocitrate lyase-like PEP mutase family enzyme
VSGTTQQAAAQQLRALHEAGVLILPNAWDAASAAVIARAGAQAIATTSGGVSWSLGRRDGQHLTRDQMAGRVREIVAAVPIPVTADIEGGYGPAPADVAATVEAVIAAGAVGVNIEDSRAPGGPLFDPAAQAARIQAARAAAVSAGLPGLFINARTDVFLFAIGAEQARLDDVRARCSAYAQAGADCLFVPGLTDLPLISKLAETSPLPVSVMAGPGAPPVADLAAAGARRVSVGTAIAQAAYALAERAAAEMLATGSYQNLSGALDFGTMNSLFP